MAQDESIKNKYNTETHWLCGICGDIVPRMDASSHNCFPQQRAKADNCKPWLEGTPPFPRHLQTESEIRDKCRADLMYWPEAEIARTPHVHCNYCGHNYPHGIFPECPRCRDQIAMAALTGLLSEQQFSADPESRAIIADEVYLFAAAVLEARKRT